MLLDHRGQAINSTVHEALDIGPETVTFHRVLDIEPKLVANYHEKLHGPNRGFSRGRTMRKIGSIPIELFAQRPELADDKALRAYLKKHPGLCTVNPRTI